jgi:manganese/iron transport system ATP-binding protein
MLNLGYHDGAHRTGAPPLEFRGVWARYGRESSDGSEDALQEVSFIAEEGARIAVVGPNGAGKSTLLKVAAGLIPATKGEVLMYGQPLAQHSCIAYVPQRNQIDWTFPVTVEDVVMMGRARQIGFFRRPRQADREAVMTSLERVGAADLARQPIGALSGGQQQRVFIARSLALETHLLLLDEPTAGLDATSQSMVLDLLDELRAQHVTVVVVTHELDVVTERFDIALLMRRALIANGSPSEVLTGENLLIAYGGSRTEGALRPAA